MAWISLKNLITGEIHSDFIYGSNYLLNKERLPRYRYNENTTTRHTSRYDRKILTKNSYTRRKGNYSEFSKKGYVSSDYFVFTSGVVFCIFLYFSIRICFPTVKY